MAQTLEAMISLPLDSPTSRELLALYEKGREVRPYVDEHGLKKVWLIGMATFIEHHEYSRCEPLRLLLAASLARSDIERSWGSLPVDWHDVWNTLWAGDQRGYFVPAFNLYSKRYKRDLAIFGKAFHSYRYAKTALRRREIIDLCENHFPDMGWLVKRMAEAAYPQSRH